MTVCVLLVKHMFRFAGEAVKRRISEREKSGKRVKFHTKIVQRIVKNKFLFEFYWKLSMVFISTVLLSFTSSHSICTTQNYIMCC